MTDDQDQQPTADFSDPAVIAKLLAEAGPLEIEIKAERLALVPKLETYMQLFPATNLTEANALIAALFDCAWLSTRRDNLADMRAALLTGILAQQANAIRDLTAIVKEFVDQVARERGEDDPYGLELPTEFDAN